MPRPQKPPAGKAAARSREQAAEIAGIRIIGGSLGGRLLEYSGDIRTRPMKDRVRESVFNLIGPAVAGTYALDLFAGTGALGLEALSRGAVLATLIERHYPTTQLIKKNAQGLGVQEKCEVVFGDAFLWARRMTESRKGVASAISNLRSQISDSPSPPWLVFCSSPFDFYVSRLTEMLDLLGSLWQAAPEGSLFLVEADERFDFSQLPEQEVWDVRTYLPAQVGLAEKRAK